MTTTTKKIYLAGPMRGYPRFNFPAFDEAAARGRALGHTIISPAELDREYGLDETTTKTDVDAKGHNHQITPEFMRGAAWRDFYAIVGPTPGEKGCDAVAMLPGWQKSKGARAEFAIAEWIGLEVLDAMTFAPLGEAKPWDRIVDKDDRLNSPAIDPGPFDARPDAMKCECLHWAETRFSERAPGGHNTACKHHNAGNPKDAIGRAKVPMNIVPVAFRALLAIVFRLGAKKYGQANWRTARVNASVYLDAAERHIGTWTDGEDTDPESGVSHLAHAAACMGIILDAEASGMLNDDRPTKGAGGALIAKLNKIGAK